MVRLDSLPVGRASLPLPWAILRMTVGKAGASMCRLGFFVPHKSTHNRTSPLVIEIQKMGYYRDLPHWVRHIPHRLRGGAVLNKLKLKGLAAFGAFPVQGLTGAGLPTALHEKSPAQSAELQFVCGERGNHPFVAPFRILMQEAPTNG